MSLYGANPDQLEHLDTTLQRQREAVDGIVAAVGGVLGGTTWMGPARDRFEAEWQGSFRQAMSRLTEAFDAAGRDCVARGQELRRVMGV